jgi:hypothetical protein
VPLKSTSASLDQEKRDPAIQFSFKRGEDAQRAEEKRDPAIQFSFKRGEQSGEGINTNMAPDQYHESNGKTLVPPQGWKEKFDPVNCYASKRMKVFLEEFVYSLPP